MNMGAASSFIGGIVARKNGECIYMDVSKNGGTQQPWGFPTKNDHVGVFWGYHYFWKHPYNRFK